MRHIKSEGFFRSPNPGSRPDQMISNKKQKICHLLNFAFPADHKVKIKENEKREKYLDLARELKNL